MKNKYSGDILIKIENISKNFKLFTALNNINTTLKKNTTTVLLGANGAGKTTLIKILTCQLFPDNGNIFFDDLNLYDDTLEIKNKTGYVSETPLFYENWKVYQYLKFCSKIRNTKLENIDYVIDLLSLNSVLNNKTHTLSKGYRQRLAFAQALIHNPVYLVLDEPFSALDPIQKNEMYNILDKLKGTKTIIFSTHQIYDIEKICDDVLILDKGNIIFHDKFNQQINNIYQIN